MALNFEIVEKFFEGFTVLPIVLVTACVVMAALVTGTPALKQGRKRTRFGISPMTVTGAGDDDPWRPPESGLPIPGHRTSVGRTRAPKRGPRSRRNLCRTERLRKHRRQIAKRSRRKNRKRQIA